MSDIGKEIIDIKNIVCDSNDLISKIHLSLSPYGLSGRYGVPTNNQLMMDIGRINIDINYNNKVLESILRILERNKDLVEEIKNRELKFV